jgi:glycosyltransferase involved in cell wall biosynthesis
VLSILIPVFNEQDNLQSIYDRLLAVIIPLNLDYELLFINDGSTDNSLAIIKGFESINKNVKFISFSRNFGHQIAISAGIDKCKGTKAVFIDADLQDPPELIVELLAKMEEGYNVVYAQRSNRKGERFLKKITAKWFYILLNKLTKINIPLNTGDFRIIDNKILEHLRKMPEKHKFLRGQIAWMGFKQTYITYDREARLNGQTGYTFRKMARLAIDGITSFSNWPLRLATLSGFAFSIIGFFLIIYTLYSRYIIKDFVPGWASQMITLVFIGGIQLIGIGIIGEYISRMNDNIRNRPLYIIEEQNTPD